MHTTAKMVMDMECPSPTLCPFGCEVITTQDTASHVSSQHGVLIHNAFLERLLDNDAPYDLPSLRAWLAFSELPMFLGAKTRPHRHDASASCTGCEEKCVFIAPCGHVSESEEEATEHQQNVCLSCSASCEFMLLQGSRASADEGPMPPRTALFWRDVRLPQAGHHTYQRLAQLLRGEGTAPSSPSRAPCPDLTSACSHVRQGAEAVRRHTAGRRAQGQGQGHAAGQVAELRKAVQELQALVDALQ